MKKLLLITAVAALTMNATLWGQSITVTSPAVGIEWCLGRTYTITWTKSGTKPATLDVSLRRAGAPETEAAVVNITSSTAYSGALGWTISASVPVGDYFIRVKTTSPAVVSDSGIFKIKSCIFVRPTVAVIRRVSMPVTFNTSMRYKLRHSSNCVARMGTGAIVVPPSEFLVGFSNYCEDRGLFCVDECLRQVYRGSPIFVGVLDRILRPLVGKSILQATLYFRHKNTTSFFFRHLGICLAKVYFYSGFGDAIYLEGRILPVGSAGNYRVDMTRMIGYLLSEMDPLYHGARHNYRMEFVGVDERMELDNSAKCLSWFDNCSLEINYVD